MFKVDLKKRKRKIDEYPIEYKRVYPWNIAFAILLLGIGSRRSVQKVGCGAVLGVADGCGKEVMKCEHP